MNFSVLLIIIMRKDIHPKQTVIQVYATNGMVYDVLLVGKFKDNKIMLDRDPHNHKAWTGNTDITISNNNYDKFMIKFGLKNKSTQ